MTIAWNWPKHLGNPTWDLSLVRTDGTVTTERVQPLTVIDAPACQASSATTPGDTYDPAQTWCATFACPPPGAYAIYLQIGDGSPSNVVVFGVADDCTTIPYTEALQQVPLAFSLPDRVHTTLAEAAPASATLPDIEAQLQALQRTYDTTQQQITETYNLQRPTWNTYQEAEQALQAAYQRALATWEALNAEWHALQREAEQARATRK